MSNISLGSKLPAKHGLNDQVGHMLNAGELVTCIVVLDKRAVEEFADTDDIVVKARMRKLEVVLDPVDVAAVKRIAIRASERRTGQTVLPFDNEEAAAAAFDGWARHPDTGDVVVTGSNGAVMTPEEVEESQAEVLRLPERPTGKPAPVEHTSQSAGYGPDFSDAAVAVTAPDQDHHGDPVPPTGAAAPVLQRPVEQQTAGDDSTQTTKKPKAT